MTDRLHQLLESTFGFSAFRPYQETVCRAAMAGKDSLLVMPTGAGKSLCYQLPGLAQAGTTLVISPLIALMEDQVAKLQSKGLRAERIHAGRDRAASRQVCFDYLEGKLDYLYIAPERLGVPRFPEMLAKRKPVLVAVDEAHCISHWGHDFRPDYRKLRDRLTLLRPCPIMAVTATATRLVQNDIVTQLGLNSASRFIHGFRRTNLAIEIVEISPGDRDQKVLSLLMDKTHRPAIVYAPTRKNAERLAKVLAEKIPTKAYHAGLPPGERDRVQSAFLQGKLEIIVATIAFGMGIDKADVRTVVHTALPGSVEAYYQEIGRAGRDGNLSRAVLMHSFADRRTHEFFHERDYPDADQLKAIFEATENNPLPKDVVSSAAELDPETFERALEKLWIHGGVEVDYAENIQRGKPEWRNTYLAQSKHKLAQLDQVNDYVKSKSCRMGHLVAHFGDEEGDPCGLCDVCAADRCVIRKYRQPSAEEIKGLAEIYDALSQHDGLSSGRLHAAGFNVERYPRRNFEGLLEGMAQAGLVKVANDIFDKDGKTIHFQRVFLTATSVKNGGFDARKITIPDVREGPKAKNPKSKRSKKKESAALNALEGVPLEIFKRLRDWRLAEAKKAEVPAFCILSDRVMRSIAIERPTNNDELLQISGIGAKLTEKYGAPILSTLNEFN